MGARRFIGRDGQGFCAIVAGAILAGGLGCGPLPSEIAKTNAGETADPVQPPKLIATERDDSGAHLVVIDERGLRMADLTRVTLVSVRDNSPRLSPDGNWVVFASSRGRTELAETSLWIVRAAPGYEPRRLTHGEFNDRDPVFGADGRVYFASNRAGSYDLFRASLNTADDRPYLEAVEPVTALEGDELSPTIAPNGSVAFMQVLGKSSRLWIKALGDEPRALTEGPTDVTPAFSPDGRYLVFAAKSRDRDDADLYVVLPDGSNRALLLDEPLGDQTGPVFSADGRYVFSTSVFRSAESKQPILASVTVIDLREQTLVLRALHDPSGALSRLGPATGTLTLDARAIHANPTYADALREVARGLLNQNQE